MSPIDIFSLVAAFLFSLCWGSFLNVVIYRLPRGQSVVKPRSRCPHCGKLIFWYENFPVISYLMLGGKCSGCKAKVSIEYPLVELGCGLLGALTWLSLYKEPYAIAYFLYYFSILCIFICGFVIDLKHRLIPDPLNILLLTIGLVYGSIKGDWISMPIGALLGYGIPFAVTWVMYKLRGVVGMGGGDLKLFAALGVILGPFGIYLNIILSSLLGSVIVGSFMMLKLHKKDQPFAFGPYIYFVAGFQIFFPNYFQVALQYIGLL